MSQSIYDAIQGIFGDARQYQNNLGEIKSSALPETKFFFHGFSDYEGKWVYSALEALACFECDEITAIEDMQEIISDIVADVYKEDLCNWLMNVHESFRYCNQAILEGALDIDKIITNGQILHIVSVYERVIAFFDTNFIYRPNHNPYGS